MKENQTIYCQLPAKTNSFLMPLITVSSVLMWLIKVEFPNSISLKCFVVTQIIFSLLHDDKKK